MTPLLAALAAALAVGVALWLVSLPLRNASIIDPFWGLLFVVMSLVASAFAQAGGPRRPLVLACVGVWALRLALHLARRNFGHGEDQRYADMRRKYGGRFWLVSLFTVFLAQPVLAWVVAAPVLAAVRSVTGLGVLDLVAGVVFALGLTLETIADGQLTRFRREPGNRGRVLDTGLWRYSRHPNYFGECVLWWGFGLFGLASGSVLGFFGPALMSVLLLRVSGVTLLESTITDRRPAYARYRRTTSAFVPWPPRSEP